MQERFPSWLQLSPWRTDQSWSRDWTIAPSSGWFDWVDGAVAWSVTVVGLPLSMVLWFPGGSPSALALASMGTQQMSPLGEATQCSRLGLRFCSSLWVCPPQFYLAPPPSLDEERGLLKNDLAIVPSNFSLELQCYWSLIYSDSQNWVNVWYFWTIHGIALNVKHI